MSEIDTIKGMVDLRSVAALEIGYPAKSKAKNYDLYQCPIHRESKGYSFAVYADHAQCFGRCGRSWDVFGLIQELRGLTFNEAKKHIVASHIGGGVFEPKPREARQAPRTESEPPNEEWQAAAALVIQEAARNLWAASGAKAMAYLQQRGLNKITIEYAQLGYIPGMPTDWHTLHGLKVPCGIVVPWIINGTIWGIKVRRAAGQPKYMQVGGGNVKGGLYWAGELEPGKPLIIDEGEFNALAMWQAMLNAGEPASVVAIGSTGNAAINLRWYPAIAAAPRVLTRMDDGSGDKAAKVLGSLSSAVRPARFSFDYLLPDQDVIKLKDPNEVLVRLGDVELANWIAREIAS